MLNTVPRGDDGTVQERVHIAPVLFEVDRLILPIQMLRGERVHLMLIRTRNERFLACLGKVKAALDGLRKPYKLHEDEFDLFGLISSYKRVIEGELEKGSMVYVNLSSGGSIQAIAANYAAMEFEGGVQAFFAYPERYEEDFDRKNPQSSSGVSRISILPHFGLKMPNESKFQFLELVGGLGEPTKGEVLEACGRSGLIICKGKSRPYGHVVLDDRFIKPLAELGLVRVERNGGRESRISLTEKGRSTLLVNGRGNTHGR
jgi:hypothetical protein